MSLTEIFVSNTVPMIFRSRELNAVKHEVTSSEETWRQQGPEFVQQLVNLWSSCFTMNKIKKLKKLTQWNWDSYCIVKISFEVLNRNVEEVLSGVFFLSDERSLDSLLKGFYSGYILPDKSLNRSAVQWTCSCS